jgi:hypothetical protein
VVESYAIPPGVRLLERRDNVAKGHAFLAARVTCCKNDG